MLTAVQLRSWPGLQGRQRSGNFGHFSARRRAVCFARRVDDDSVDASVQSVPLCPSRNGIRQSDAEKRWQSADFDGGQTLRALQVRRRVRNYGKVCGKNVGGKEICPAF